MQLAGALSGALSDAGVSLDARPFRPHLTLARRCRGPYPKGEAGPFSWEADRIVLMQSQTGADGARYTELAARPLGATA